MYAQAQPQPRPAPCGWPCWRLRLHRAAPACLAPTLAEQPLLAALTCNQDAQKEGHHQHKHDMHLLRQLAAQELGRRGRQRRQASGSSGRRHDRARPVLAQHASLPLLGA